MPRLTFMLLQLASRIWASCDAGVRLACEPNGEIMDDMARFSFDGVLLKDSARPTCYKRPHLSTLRPPVTTDTLLVYICAKPIDCNYMEHE